VGIGLGLFGSVALSRFLGHLLYGIEPLHPATYVLATLTLALAALIACLVPALRVTSVDPLSAIGSE
jgi:ABC-type antimicrobial peptide transport system permease subunit